MKNRFRIWDNKYNDFVYIDLLDNPSNLILLFKDIKEYFTSSYIKDNPKYIQQCTGVEDITGTPIYEGDIVRFFSKYTGNHTGKIIFNSKLASFYVKYEPAFIGINDQINLIKYNLRVIGNVYEGKNE